MTILNEVPNSLIVFRKTLHQYPELSKKESITTRNIKAFVSLHHPDLLVEGIGNTGLAAVYNGKKPGKTVLIRADIDALPIMEANDFDYKSTFPGVAHKCGHDGHTAILAGVSALLGIDPPGSGRVILLFQPAEETGEGALLVLNDPKFENLKPDYVFALHNLPGIAEHTIVVRKQLFAAASRGMIIKLFGKTSHAANPEHGISPALAVAEIIQQLVALSKSAEGFKDFKLITIIHSRIGEIAFGTTPGYAVVMATLRSFRNDDMETLVQKAIRIVESAADKYLLQENIAWREEFPSTVVDDFCFNLVKSVAEENNFQIIEPETPFRWSEDFGYFTMKFPGAMFGIGAGESHPALHDEAYDFPDNIIPTAIKMFDGIIRKILI